MEINYEGLPENLAGGVQRYIEAGIPPGGFLTAVLENKLAESLGRADTVNRKNIFSIVEWIYNYAPAMCWGSPQAVKNWVDEGGLEGRAEGRKKRERREEG